MKKKEARSTTPPVVPMEAAAMLRFHRCIIVTFFLTHRSFCNSLASNLSRYCTAHHIVHYTCDLNIVGTRIEAMVSSSRN
jgi:hypothetical protein